MVPSYKDNSNTINFMGLPKFIIKMATYLKVNSSMVLKMASVSITKQTAKYSKAHTKTISNMVMANYTQKLTLNKHQHKHRL